MHDLQTSSKPLSLSEPQNKGQGGDRQNDHDNGGYDIIKEYSLKNKERF